MSSVVERASACHEFVEGSDGKTYFWSSNETAALSAADLRALACEIDRRNFKGNDPVHHQEWGGRLHGAPAMGWYYWLNPECTYRNGPFKTEQEAREDHAVWLRESLGNPEGS